MTTDRWSSGSTAPSVVMTGASPPTADSFDLVAALIEVAHLHVAVIRTFVTGRRKPPTAVRGLLTACRWPHLR